MSDRIYKALILNDYLEKPYATWFKEGKKTIETRKGRLFKHRGDLIICCGKTNSIGANRGRALCMVNVFDGREMRDEDVEKACIEVFEKAMVLLTDNLRHFSRDFMFADYVVTKNFQGIFDLRLPPDVEIITAVI